MKFLSPLKSEPALVVSVVVAVLIAIAGHFGIVLDKASLTDVLLPIATALLIRPHVKPVRKSRPARRIKG